MTWTIGRKSTFTPFSLQRITFSLCFNFLYVKYGTVSQKTTEARVADFSKTRRCQISSKYVGGSRTEVQIQTGEHTNTHLPFYTVASHFVMYLIWCHFRLRSEYCSIKMSLPPTPEKSLKKFRHVADRLCCMSCSWCFNLFKPNVSCVYCQFFYIQNRDRHDKQGLSP